MADVDINWLAVLLATVAAMVIGFVWFSVLSEQWMAAAGRTREDIGKGPGAPLYAIVTALQLVTAVVLALETSEGPKTYAFGPSFRVRPAPDFYAEVKALLGEAAVH